MLSCVVRTENFRFVNQNENLSHLYALSLRSQCVNRGAVEGRR